MRFDRDHWVRRVIELNNKCAALKTENAEMATELQRANQEIARLNALLAPTPWPHAIPAARVVRIADAVETAMGWAPMWLARDVARECGGWWMYEDTDAPVFNEDCWYTYGGGRVADVCGFPNTVAPADSLISVTAAREWVAHSGETAEDEARGGLSSAEVIDMVDEINAIREYLNHDLIAIAARLANVDCG